MAVTTTDLSHKDILSVVVRFVNDKGKPEEKLLEVREIVDKSTKGMANEILETLRYYAIKYAYLTITMKNNKSKYLVFSLVETFEQQ